jgi:hypothetical protein
LQRQARRFHRHCLKRLLLRTELATPGVRQKGLDNMKQISTGAGLVALSVGMVATAFIAAHRGGSEAFAQVTGGDRRVVSSFVREGPGSQNGMPVFAYRIWSDNAIDMRLLGLARWADWPQNAYFSPTTGGDLASWRTIDNGTSGFRPLTDVDMDGEVSAGDISNVLLDMGTRSDDVPPPPIDCTVNAPR